MSPLHESPGYLLSAEVVRQYALDLGADVVGIARAAPAAREAEYRAWLRQGCAGGMTYLSRHLDQRFDPRRLLPGARSVIVVGVNYSPTPAERARAGTPYRVAKYAWGHDYHAVLRRLLRRLRARLAAGRPSPSGRICVDTAPFMDKYWAEKAGIGWQGKHTNLVSRSYGSWLLIGSLVCKSAFDRYDEPHGDFCGSCTACLDVCPTRAFPQPYRLDATRCLSYWTIEAKAKTFPPDIRAALGGWVFGCDLCLDVCPWNKFAQPRRIPELSRQEMITLLEKGSVHKFSEEEFAAAFRLSPVRRPGRNGVIRNIEACRRQSDD